MTEEFKANEFKAEELLVEKLNLKEVSDDPVAQDSFEKFEVADLQEGLSNGEEISNSNSTPSTSDEKTLQIAPRAPLVVEGDPGYGECLNHPVIIFGQLVGITSILGLFFWALSSGFAVVTSASASAMVTTTWSFFIVSLVLAGILVAALLLLAGLEHLFNKLRMPKATVFCFAIYDPIFRLLGLIPNQATVNLDHFSLHGFANFLRSNNQFAEAAACFSRALSSLSPLCKERMAFERLYSRCLLYDGQKERALKYSESILEYWQGVTKNVTDAKSIQRLAHAVYSTSTLYHLIGETEKGCRLQHGFYQKTRNLTLESDAKTIMLLCEGEALLREQEFEKANDKLKDCCNSLRLTSPSYLKLAAHQAFTISLAHCDDKATALQQLTIAEKELGDSPTNDERLSNTLMRIEVFQALNELEQVKSSIKETFIKLHPEPGSFLYESLKKKAELIDSAELIGLMKSDDAAQSSVRPKPDTSLSLAERAERSAELPSKTYFKTVTGVLPFILSSLSGLLVMSIIASMHFSEQAGNLPWLCSLLVLSIGLRIYISFYRRQKRARVKSDLGSAKRIRVTARTDGHTSVCLIGTVGGIKDGKIFASESLLEEVKAIVGESEFPATVFEKDGKYIAIEIFGCYSTVSSSHIFP